MSRVLSGTSTVNPELAARVRAAANRLGYRTNRVARALRRRATQTVGMVVPDLTNPFFPAAVQAVERALRDFGLSLLLCDAGNDVGLEAELVRNLFDHQIDGLLISPCDRIASRQAVRLAASQVPLIQIDRRALGGMPYVGVDQAAAMGKVVDHLQEQGCERFAYITPHPAISTASERLDAFLRRAGPLDPTAGQRVFRGDFSLEWGHEAARRIIAERPRPDAIVCANDLNAIGALQALHEKGIAVPGEIAVSGFDDTVLAVACQPQLTTVRQPLEDLGRQAVNVLRAAMADPSLPPTFVVLKAGLVVRESTHRAGPGPGGTPSPGIAKRRGSNRLRHCSPESGTGASLGGIRCPDRLYTLTTTSARPSLAAGVSPDSAPSPDASRPERCGAGRPLMKLIAAIADAHA